MRQARFVIIPESPGFSHEEYVKELADGSGYWIRKNNQPVLGNTSLSAVVLQECYFQILAPDRVRVVMAGCNRDTGHVFRLDRTMYSYGQGLEQHGQQEAGGEAGGGA